MDTDMDICRLAHTRFVISEHDAWLLLNRRMTDFSSALVTRVASLRDNPQYSDLEIITPTRSFHAHKIILSARSSDWGRGVDLSTSVVLDWKAFSDQTCEDILDYIYLDEVKCLVDKTYGWTRFKMWDFPRGIQSMLPFGVTLASSPHDSCSPS